MRYRTTVRSEWPGRPTRAAFLTPRGLRERVAAWLGHSLIYRYNLELGAEYQRAEAGWDEAMKAKWRA